MTAITVVGIDPGLVDTGIMLFTFQHSARCWSVDPFLVKGIDVPQIQKVLVGPFDHIFIEAYKPRSHYKSDPRMVQGVRDIHRAFPGSKVLNNAGAQKIVTQPLMSALYCWAFTTPSHHADLRAAARIALFGILKNPELNEVLSDFVLEHVIEQTHPWRYV